MKQVKLLAFTSLLAVAAFSLIVYSSCTKNKCAGVVCQNGGSCSGGNCSCPTGYSGNNCENSSIVFSNNTFTPISISVNGTSSTIAVGSSVTFVGSAGSNASVAASTSGSTTTGDQVGELYSWSFTDVFPSNGDGLTEPLDVDASYFFLQVQNNDPWSIITLYVNYGLTAQTTENVSIPHDGVVYGIGYYKAYSNTKVSVDYSNSSYATSGNLSIPNQANSTATVTFL